MRHTGLLCGDEGGSVLVSSIVVLLLLTLVGLMGSRTAVYELNLSGNDRAIHEMRISADSAAAVAAQRFEQLSDAMCRDRDWGSTTRQSWYSRGEDDQFDDIVDNVEKNSQIAAYTQDIENWILDNSIPRNSTALLEEQAGVAQADWVAPAEFQNCRYQVIDVGIAAGASLKIGNNITNMHNLLISGSSQQGQGKSIVQIGYRKRY